jgi:anti-anti-sigma factor
VSAASWQEDLYPGAPPIVIAPAEIDITNWAFVDAELAAASRHDATVIVDMTTTTFCDSSGIRVFLVAHDRAAADGGELRLAAVDPAVLRTLQLVGADRVLSIYPTVGEALQRH